MPIPFRHDSRHIRTLIALIQGAALLMSLPAAAVDDYAITNEQGREIFRLQVYGISDTEPYWDINGKISYDSVRKML